MKEGELFENVSSKHLLVVGDLMLDEYVAGAVHRQSPEAPVKVLLTDHIYHKVGGAANVALNIQQLGCKATLVGLTGDDAAGETLQAELDTANLTAYVLKDSKRPTTVKRRYLNGNRHLLRVDTEDTSTISPELESQVLLQIESLLEDEAITGMVLSDYNKGLLTPYLINELMKLATGKGLPVYVDPKRDNFWLYKGATIMKPNQIEMAQAINVKKYQLNKDNMLSALAKLRAEMIICTMAADGVLGIAVSTFMVVEAEQIEVVDVSGAGDSVLAAISIGHQCGLTLNELMQVTNAAGKLACLQSGVAVLSLNVLKNEVTRL